MMTVLEWPGSGAEWDAIVDGLPDATVMHLWGWKAIVQNAYGHRTWYLAAYEGDEPRGVLPLTLVQSPLLGRALVSMPFMDYGGVAAGSHDKAALALVEAALEIARGERATLVLRHFGPRELPLPCSTEKVTMLLELGPTKEAQWKRLPSERRNRIRKGTRSGLSAAVVGAEGLADFYAVFSANMRDLGSPVHSRSFFRQVLAQLADRCRIVLVQERDRAVGAGLMLLYRGMISIPWVSSLRESFEKCPNQVLYWEAMRWGIANGYRVLDLGRSSRDSGTFEAKRQWGATPVQLYWHYYPETAVPPGEEVKRLAWGVRLWQRLPLGVSNTIGPWFRRGIPN
jgi:FemAB-related protein (PEP-CTERM system-associated)